MGVGDVLPRPHDVVRARVLLHAHAESLGNGPVLRAPALRHPAAPNKAETKGRLKRPLVNAGLSARHDFLALSLLNTSPLFQGLPPRHTSFSEEIGQCQFALNISAVFVVAEPVGCNQRKVNRLLAVADLPKRVPTIYQTI